MLKQSCSSLKSAMDCEGRVGIVDEQLLLLLLLFIDAEDARDSVTAFLC